MVACSIAPDERQGKQEFQYTPSQRGITVPSVSIPRKKEVLTKLLLKVRTITAIPQLLTNPCDYSPISDSQSPPPTHPASYAACPRLAQIATGGRKYAQNRPRCGPRSCSRGRKRWTGRIPGSYAAHDG